MTRIPRGVRWGAAVTVAALVLMAARAQAAVGSPSLEPASITGLAGSLATPMTGGVNPVSTLTDGAGALAGVGLTALGSWVLDGAKAALQETASVINRTTAPRLQSTWFSSTYWRVAGMAALLTLPFLFAAAVQALLRSDLTLLIRSALGYLPLAVIGVSLAAPLTMLLLAVTDEMCSVIAGAGSAGGVHFLDHTALEIAGLTGLSGSPFLGFAVGLLTLAAAVALALEMLIRQAAVYVVLLMAPLAFSALVWPARRVWAIRLTELLIALILSKFVIVAVLALAGAAYGSQGLPSTTRLLTAMSLVLLSTFAPWAMLRILPFTELAAGAAGALRAEVPRLTGLPSRAAQAADRAASLAESLPQRLRRDSEQADLPTFSELGDGPAHHAPARGDRASAAIGAGEGTAGPTATGGDGAGLSDGSGQTAASAGGSGESAAPAEGAGQSPVLAPQVGLTPAATTDSAVAESPASPAGRMPLSELHPIWRAEDSGAPPFGLGPDGWPERADYEASPAPPIPADTGAPLPRRQENEGGPL